MLESLLKEALSPDIKLVRRSEHTESMYIVKPDIKLEKRSKHKDCMYIVKPGIKLERRK